jgi:uncharacterized protein (TIGR00369 family)
MSEAGLGVCYVHHADSTVSARFVGRPELEGYPGLLHGGVIAALIDGAMTNCLFARGVCAVTAELNVRYLAGISSAEELLVTAAVEYARHRYFRLVAEISQRNTIKVRAGGKFVEPTSGPTASRQHR